MEFLAETPCGGQVTDHVKVLALSFIYARRSTAVMFFIISNYKKKDYENLTNII